MTRDFTIDLSPGEGREFMHLILTGRNGSGKTFILDRIADYADERRGAAWLVGLECKSSDIKVRWTDAPLATSQSPILPTIISLPARRQVLFETVRGPAPDTDLTAAAQLEQVLVNLRTQVALARGDADEVAATEPDGQIRAYESILRDLLNEPGLRLVFDRRQISYFIELGGQPLEFNHLPDGFRSAIRIWAEIRSTIRKSGQDRGIVLIDEVEGHLHLELQARLLPFLTRTFPRMQFIAATHSPAVISSIDGAVVYDLSTHTRVLSDDLRGVRYGALMTSHFGIAADFDLASLEELRELERLHTKQDRSDTEEARLRELADRLSRRSHSLALLVRNAGMVTAAA